MCFFNKKNEKGKIWLCKSRHIFPLDSAQNDKKKTCQETETKATSETDLTMRSPWKAPQRNKQPIVGNKQGICHVPSAFENHCQWLAYKNTEKPSHKN